MASEVSFQHSVRPIIEPPASSDLESVRYSIAIYNFVANLTAIKWSRLTKQKKTEV